MFGSYERFKRDILRRNGDPIGDDGWFRYRARDGALIEFGEEYVAVDGVEFSPDEYPRADMPGLRDLTITAGGASVVFDVDGLSTSGDTGRVPANIVFGGREE